MPIGNEGTRILAGTLTGLASILIFDHFCPPHEDVRNTTPFNNDVESMERLALGLSTGLVLITAGVMKSAEVFIIGGAVILGVDFASKHANAVNPDTGKMQKPVDSAQSTSFPMPDYNPEESGYAA